MEEDEPPRSDVDFESESFDPNAALSSDDDSIKLPVPNAKIFNNLDEYFLKSFSQIKSLKPPKSPPKEIKRNFDRILIASGSQSSSASQSSLRRRELPTILTRMKQSSGPMSILYKSLNNRINILIRRRKASPIFSGRFARLNGLLIAFDKHCNLVMSDVDEKYQKYKSKTDLTVVHVNNHVNQLFIRGDNVILISLK